MVVRNQPKPVSKSSNYGPLFLFYFSNVVNVAESGTIMHVFKYN